ncbi:MAG TPA: site-2 protease family protein [Kofleriaceae bacterium]
MSEPLEADLVEASRLFTTPAPPSGNRLTLLLVTVAVFVAVSAIRGESTIETIAMIVGTVFVHELGHALGMLVFGYRDVKIFFIPLLGAATSGKARGVAAWKQAIVLLLGPVPGLVAALVLFRIDGPSWLRSLAVVLLVVNAFNLLPLEPLDGGRLWQLLLFSRNRHAEIGFRAITGLAVVAGSIALHLWVLAAVGYLILITVRFQARLLAAAAKLRPLDLPSDPAALGDDQRLVLARATWDMLPPKWQDRWRGKPRLLANVMEQLHDRATRRSLSFGGAAAIFVVWCGGIAISFAGVLEVRPRGWALYTSPDGHFTAEMCGPAVVGDHQVHALGKACDETIVWRDAPDELAWDRDLFVKLTARGSDSSAETIEKTEIHRSAPNGETERIYIRWANGTGYVLSYIGEAGYARRFKRTFTTAR